jgi:hypothetical protein
MRNNNKIPESPRPGSLHARSPVGGKARDQETVRLESTVKKKNEMRMRMKMKRKDFLMRE